MTDEQIKAIEWAIGMASQHNIHKSPLRELLANEASKPAPSVKVYPQGVMGIPPYSPPGSGSMTVKPGISHNAAPSAEQDERGGWDGDSEESRTAFRDCDSTAEPISLKTPWQIWRSACAWQARAASTTAVAQDESEAFRAWYSTHKVTGDVAEAAWMARAASTSVNVAQDERGAWFALADGAAASLENAAVCMSDSDAKRSAEGASAFVRKRCRELLGSEQVRLMEWRGGAGLLWDVYAFGKWAKRIVSPIEWDAHTVYLDMVRAGYSEHIDLRLVSASNNANPDEPQSAANVAQGAAIAIRPDQIAEIANKYALGNPRLDALLGFVNEVIIVNGAEYAKSE